MLGDHELQHGIAKKLQPLIVEVMPLRLVPEARVRQRFREQQGIAKLGRCVLRADSSSSRCSGEAGG
jgi:hypothetical protein